ncbi:hypothetical protein [Bradyrhizobium ottawaense]|uniref:hypothetical protein n=1 Tax=Bradyrhizobium ottawaense TaxID=931866 RepID=UPI0030F36F35
MNPKQARAVAEKGEIGCRQPLGTPDLLEDDVGLDSARPLVVALLMDEIRDSEDESRQYGDRNELARDKLKRIGQRRLYDRLERAFQHGLGSVPK